MTEGLSLAPIETLVPIGVVKNVSHQTACGFIPMPSYELAFVEFDDQGRCHNRSQMEAVATRLDSLLADEIDVILLVFVHGWKHDARSDDTNLMTFQDVLAAAALHENSIPGSSGPRQVLGIFVGWRGLSEYGIGDAVANLTFWGRQAAGQRVATGSVRELFGRLRHYRRHRRENEGAPLLVITGHSFGGMIVYSALAQSLIESASSSIDKDLPSFADLVLLINPAIEAARYLPIYDLVTSNAFRLRTKTQLPIFVCAQADNDMPVGTWFPIGDVHHRFVEATIGELEQECLTHAMGFVPSFRTHTLSGPSGDYPFVLTPKEIEQANPFWMVGASKEVIDGHSGIWQKPFRDFLASLLFQHVLNTKDLQKSTGVPASIVADERGSLAGFARVMTEKGALIPEG